MKHDPSITDAAVEALSEADQDRLARILDDYLIDVAQGAPITPEQLLQRHPEEAEYLRGYLSGLQLFHAAAIEGNQAKSAAIPMQVGQRLGQVIGDYRLIHEIGRGGMGVVYEAEQISLLRRVALKILPFTSAHEVKHIERFKNEAQAAAQVHHPNIVPVFAVGEENGVHYYAMQLIGGHSLATFLEGRRDPPSEDCGTTAPNNTATADGRRVKGLDGPACLHGKVITQTAVGQKSIEQSAADTFARSRRVACWGAEAAAALHAAHEFGIVHRDVKPSNLLLDEQGKLWITDFGLARFRKNTSLTQTGDVLGTMRYMSPEQALGRTALVDHRTDIYSLGITLYELAALQHPAQGIADAQVPFERARSSYKPIRHWNRHIPVDFQTIVTKAIGEFPHERYATAGEFAEDLRRFIEGRPILASPPSTLTRASKWTKRHRGSVAAAATVFFIGLFANFILLTREKAVTERAYAGSQENLRQANDVLDRFSTRLVDQLAAVPGAEGVRQQLLEDSLGLYQRFLDRAAGDPALATELAAAYGKLGNLTEKMGHPASALKKHQAALKIWEERAEEQPKNINYICALTSCLNNIGLLLAELRRPQDALKAFETADKRLQVALALLSDSAELKTQAAATYANLGLVLRQMGAWEEAIAKFRAAIEIQEELIATEPGNETVLRELAANYSNLGSLYEPDAAAIAREAYQKALAIQRELVQVNPINRIYQAELARTYNNLGYLLSQHKDWKQAEICYTDAIQLQTNLVAASPLVNTYRRDLAISHNNLGMLQSRSDKPGDAEASFREASRLQRISLDSQPADVVTLSYLGGVYNNLGMLLDNRARLQDAGQAFEQAIDFQKQALELSSSTKSIRELLNKHFANYAKYLRQHNQPSEAVRVALERKKLWPGEPEHLLAIGQELTVDYQLMIHCGVELSKQQECANAAIATLREAVTAGLPPQRLKNTSFALLQELSSFQRLLAGAGGSYRVWRDAAALQARSKLGTY